MKYGLFGRVQSPVGKQLLCPFRLLRLTALSMCFWH